MAMQQEGLQALKTDILAEARQQAEEEIHRAELVRSASIQQVEAEAETESQTLLRQAERETEDIRRKARSSAEVEKRKLILATQEELIGRVMREAMEKLRTFGTVEERRELIIRLIVEAAREIDADVLTVQAAERDFELLSREALREAELSLASLGASKKLEKSDRPVNVSGGVIVTDKAGRIIVDNSLEARLRRREGFLRSKIWDLLTSGREKEPGS